MSPTTHRTENTGEKQVADSDDGQAPNAQVDAKPTAPELSIRSALAVAASALAYFCTSGLASSFGVFQQYYTAHYLPDRSNFQISWIGSMLTFTFFAFAAPAGLMADRYGPTVPICIGATLQLFAVFMISLCREYYQFFLAQGVLLGTGMSFVAIPSSTIVPLYFKRNRGLAQGISIAGSSLGGVLWPVALDQLLNHDRLDFGWSLRVVGFAMIPQLALVIIGVRRPVESNNGKQTPQTIEEGSPNPSKKKSNLKKLASPSFILLCLGLAIAYFGFWCPLFYISTYAVHIGTSESLAFYMLSVLNGASMLGRIFPGFIADRLGTFNIITFTALGSALLAFTWTAADSVAGLVVWTAAYGFVSGALLSLQLVCATAAGGESGTGAAVGVVLTSVSLTGLFGTPIAGELVGHGGYIALSCFAGATLALGGLLLGAARFAREKRLWAKV